MQPETSKLQQHLFQATQAAQAAHHRLTLTLVGDQRWGIDTAHQFFSKPQHQPSLWLSTQLIDHTHCIPSSQASHYLGQEFNTLVYDGHSGIDVDAIAAISGTVKGGGLLVFLLPSLVDLASFADPAKERLVSWPYESQDVKGRFLQRLAHTLISDQHIIRIYQDNTPNYYPALLSPAAPGPKVNLTPYANEQQAQVAEAITHVISGHRRRPLIITAARGRGKSAALGIVSAKLLQERRVKRILVCAPNPQALTTLFHHAADYLHQPMTGYRLELPFGQIEFVAPDAVCREQPTCDLLIIDEAATIPVPLLQQMLINNSRVIFSTTTDGYEGTGRAFAIRFFQILDRQTPGWRHETLTLPIRWAADDPTEAWLFKALLLDAQPADEAAIRSEAVNECQIESLAQDVLAANESDLNQLMGLFLLAHYQTQPNDLRHLLDSPGVQIFIARHAQQIVAAVVLEKEGAIDEALSDAIYGNQRRLRGHRLPQTLSVYCGFPEANRFRYARIMRIAVHPALQNKGLGRKLLSTIAQQTKQQGYDFLGANYGATADLLAFWECCGFTHGHLGFKRNTASGAHAVTSLMALSVQGQELLDKLKNRFTEQLAVSLADAHQDLEPDITLALLKDTLVNANPLTEQDRLDIKSFIAGYRGYESNCCAIERLVQRTIGNRAAQQVLDDEERAVLVGKVLQKHSWPQIIKQARLNDRRQALDKLRNAVEKLDQQL